MSFISTVEHDLSVASTFLIGLLKATEPILALTNPVLDTDAKLAIGLLQVFVDGADPRTATSITARIHAIAADPTKAAAVLAQFGIQPSTVVKVATVTDAVVQTAQAVEQVVAPQHSGGGDTN